jgi:hypothetical protein
MALLLVSQLTGSRVGTSQQRLISFHLRKPTTQHVTPGVRGTSTGLKPIDTALCFCASNFCHLIKATVSETDDAAPAHSRFGSKAADRCALITTARHSEAASPGTKRDTGWSSPKSCRSRTGSLGPQAHIGAVRQLDRHDSRLAEIPDIGALNYKVPVMSALTSTGKSQNLVDAH